MVSCRNKNPQRFWGTPKKLDKAGLIKLALPKSQTAPNRELGWFLAATRTRSGSGELAKLLGLCESGLGVVPQTENGFDPLAATYPVTALPITLRRIQTGDYRLQDFVAELVQQGLVVLYPVSPREKKLLQNWNWPSDVFLRFDPENRE